MKARDLYASDYFDARQRFLAAARMHNAWTAAFPITARGPKGEELTIDTAYLGAGAPRRLLVVSSGTHGVEGYAGTAVQIAFLKQLTARMLRKDQGVLLVHALNPYGYAHNRRTNEHNVDLNRNALEHFPGPANPAYARLNRWLNPPSPPGADLFVLRGLGYLLSQGPAAVKQAIAGGQYEFPKGIFYGGTALAESTRRFADILGDASFKSAQRVVYIDLHTGLGRRGGYKVLVDFEERSEPYARMREWFGAKAVQGNRPKRSIAYRVTGNLTDLAGRLFRGAEVYPAVLEFGTYSLVHMIGALRAENRAHFYGKRGSARATRARDALIETFCPRAAAWRSAIVRGGLRVLNQALAALGR
ncbi:hypothetical protein SVA_3586 [Sulfurifustis variabilis]|uniref:Deacylase n=1 Tax=Sulfurifustis variabilis TaxID=1675686 RepID=A0A1C7AFK2_9GAMM|nr:DUF2817 domain-containing protein [Sulfurifustis variabilis]BAU50122.1 hypothetical protein SVA_3586 [Sulfurifustis variabilis]